MKKTLSLVLAVMMLAVVLAACGGGSNSTPEGAVQKFIDAINNNNTNALAECFEPSLQETYKSIFALYTSMGGGTLAEAMEMGSGKLALTINGVTVDGDTATVNATVASDGETSTSDVPVKKVDGKWYIDMGDIF